MHIRKSVSSSAYGLLKKIGMLFVLLLFPFFFGQSAPSDSVGVARITLVGNAKIFSSDSAFNRQVKAKKVLLRAQWHFTDNKKTLVAISAPDPVKKAGRKVRLAEIQRQEKARDNIIKTVEKAQQKKQTVLAVKKSSGREEFLSGSGSSKIGFLVPQYKRGDSKSGISSPIEYSFCKYLQRQTFHRSGYSSSSKTEGYQQKLLSRPPPSLFI